MTSSSRNPKDKELFKVQLVSNEVKQPNFKPILEVAYFPPKVVTMQDVRRFYNCMIGEIGDMEIQQAYDNYVRMGY